MQRLNPLSQDSSFEEKTMPEQDSKVHVLKFDANGGGLVDVDEVAETSAIPDAIHDKTQIIIEEDREDEEDIDQGAIPRNSISFAQMKAYDEAR